jgi:dTDP-4-amino-4,6-dideoxygalactose transaminase
MDEIMEIADANNIPVIEDCAQSYGALFKVEKSVLSGKWVVTR